MDAKSPIILSGCNGSGRTQALSLPVSSVRPRAQFFLGGGEKTKLGIAEEP